MRRRVISHYNLSLKAGHSSECGKILGKMLILSEKFVTLHTIPDDKNVTKSVKPARKG